MTRDETVAYWVDSSDADFEVTLSLIEKNHYVWGLVSGPSCFGKSS